MKILRTGHIIADTVASALEEGLYGYNPTIGSVGYGILRGTAQSFRGCDKDKIPWFNIDRGYFKPGHYDGYYRVSMCGTQQTNLRNFEPDYARLEALGISFPKPCSINSNPHTLIVPPTDAVSAFFNIKWKTPIYNDSAVIVREKGCLRPLQEDLNNCLRVVTFNSSIGWEALRQGIPVYSDPDHSIVGAYQKTLDKPLHLDYKERIKLFAIMAGLQLTLQEIRDGKICQLLEKLMSLSDGTQENKSLPMSQPTPLLDALQFQQNCDF